MPRHDGQRGLEAHERVAEAANLLRQKARLEVERRGGVRRGPERGVVVSPRRVELRHRLRELPALHEDRYLG